MLSDGGGDVSGHLVGWRHAVAETVRMLDIIFAYQADERSADFRSVQHVAELGCVSENVIAEVWTPVQHRVEFARDGLVDVIRQGQVDLDETFGDEFLDLLVVEQHWSRPRTLHHTLRIH